jgi:hypothetical protein
MKRLWVPAFELHTAGPNTFNLTECAAPITRIPTECVPMTVKETDAELKLALSNYNESNETEKMKELSEIQK